MPSANISLDLIALGLSSLNSLMLFGYFDGVTIKNLSHLIDISGSDDLAVSLPDDVQKALAKLENLSLQTITIQLGKGFSINGVGITIALPGIDTTVLPGFTVRKLIANFRFFIQSAIV